MNKDEKVLMVISKRILMTSFRFHYELANNETFDGLEKSSLRAFFDSR